MLTSGQRLSIETDKNETTHTCPNMATPKGDYTSDQNYGPASTSKTWSNCCNEREQRNKVRVGHAPSNRYPPHGSTRLRAQISSHPCDDRQKEFVMQATAEHREENNNDNSRQRYETTSVATNKKSPCTPIPRSRLAKELMKGTSNIVMSLVKSPIHSIYIYTNKYIITFH